MRKLEEIVERVLICNNSKLLATWIGGDDIRYKVLADLLTEKIIFINDFGEKELITNTEDRDFAFDRIVEWVHKYYEADNLEFLSTSGFFLIKP